MRCLNCGIKISSGNHCSKCAKKLREPSLKVRLDNYDKNNLSYYKKKLPPK